MSLARSGEALTFASPGPGTWLLDAVHMPRPFTRFQQAIHPGGILAGSREGFSRYGLLVDTLDFRMVNGLAYFAPVPAAEAEIPARFAAAAIAVRDRVWRADLARWDRHVKPAAIRDHMALQAVDPKSLSTPELAQHVERCIEHLTRMVQQHHSFSAASIIPVGDFMASVSEWTGTPAGEFLAVLSGFAPESAGAFKELDRLVMALRADPAARAILAADSPAANILASLRAAPGEAGAAATAYLDIVSYRLLDSLDTGDATAIEMPDILLQGLRVAMEVAVEAAPMPGDASAHQLAELRERVPAEHRDAFDDLLAEARLMSRLRDERGLYSDVWAAGIARRALLEFGARLVADGRLHEAAHVIEADPDEIRALFAGLDDPDADELASRSDDRASLRAADAPPFLGEPPQPHPSLDGLPPAVARLMRALGTSLDALFLPSHAISDSTAVRGTGANPGIFNGIARVVSGPAEFGRLQRGDVLVTATTTEAFNIVLPLLGGIVTDTGGLLSHAAIVGREYGIPCVVGCRDASARITDGSRVTINGSTGEVRLDGA